jgi:hypothetical protein
VLRSGQRSIDLPFGTEFNAVVMGQAVSQHRGEAKIAISQSGSDVRRRQLKHISVSSLPYAPEALEQDTEFIMPSSHPGRTVLKGYA